jgi:hypothetical protein
MMYTWLSFRDPDLNLNLGCTIVRASNFHEAVTKAHDLGINPGGEVLGWKMTEQQVIAEGLEIERLYNRSELKQMGYKNISQENL